MQRPLQKNLLCAAAWEAELLFPDLLPHMSRYHEFLNIQLVEGYLIDEIK